MSPRLEQYVDSRGEHRWRTIAANGRIVGDSGEGYLDDADAQHGALVTLDALLSSNIPGVRSRVEAWLAGDGPSE